MKTSKKNKEQTEGGNQPHTVPVLTGVQNCSQTQGYYADTSFHND